MQTGKPFVDCVQLSQPKQRSCDEYSTNLRRATRRVRSRAGSTPMPFQVQAANHGAIRPSEAMLPAGPGILRNDLYVGRLVWNKQTYVRDPSTGKRLARVRNPSERITIDVPELRIVDNEVWRARAGSPRHDQGFARRTKSRRTEFWKQRRPKHLLTGLIYCGECGGHMTAIGRDYLACGAARSGAGCSNRRSIRRTRVEAVVLEGLKTHLMAPELVAEFVRAFHEELNRKRATDDLQREGNEQELLRVSKKLRGLYDAIADGLRSPGLQNELLALEGRQTQLRKAADAMPSPAPRFHPKLAELYRKQVTELHAALNDPEARTEAAEILRTLVERITLRSDASGHTVVLTGDIVKLLALPGGRVPASFESSVKVVAGARNHLDLQLGKLLSSTLVVQDTRFSI